MKNILKRLLVMLVVLTMVFSMTSCDLILELIEIWVSTESLDILVSSEKREAEILPDEDWYMQSSNGVSGYNFNPAYDNSEIWEVNSAYEIDRIFDYAFANLLECVTIDLKNVVGDYADDITYYIKYVYLPQSKLELQHITEYVWEIRGSVVKFSFTYDNATASVSLKQTAANTYEGYENINMLVRDTLDGGPTRTKSFNNFAINKNNAGEMAVYNSESLWWALEHNYLPVFPVKNTKAEAFYEQAKSILRKIINDDMTDYEKTLAIYEYLIDAVSYDFDAYNALDTKDDSPNNVCYFLEGVFEWNRAVCDGKSKAFVVLCRIEGIECLRDFGSSYSGGAGHAWNYVKLDGTWYMVDTTVGDAVYEGIKAEITDYSHFLCSTRAHGGRYKYSGIWDSVLAESDRNASLSLDYYESVSVMDDVDFHIRSDEELGKLVFYAINLIQDKPGVYSMKIRIGGGGHTYEDCRFWLKNQMAGYSNITYSFKETGDVYMIIFTVSEAK